ncbi:DUF1349 domain-containing protein [Microlunatus flavus]|uniref:DUF1349 domain-containing protein n=1 Tax=Microlunatus flavus TaxID=1036181 RepID=A0A1H8ZSP6_9ACTN|nr:DUF1349 domain-containing protein [Microlunatus flavus]SEP67500.1 hypothetical protein SAMN05421756_101350 [Microlunatus flavus]
MSLQELVGRGTWTHEPEAVRLDGAELRVTAVEGSDAWRTTSYGFVHDSEHALVEELPGEFGLEVSFRLDYAEQFDQAGLFLRAGADEWIKAGVEFSDGVPWVGAVVTHQTSDWSVAPVPEWAGQVVTVRASRSGDAVTIRARVDDEPYRLVRLAHLDPDASVAGGLLMAAPTRAGLTVTFTGHAVGEPDSSLH